MSSRYQQAEADVEWFYAEGQLLFDIRAIDNERVKVQTSSSGDPTDDRRHAQASRYFRVRERLTGLPSMQQKVLRLRYEPVTWRGAGDFQNWWNKYGQFANLIRGLDIQGSTEGSKITAARQLIRQALNAYMKL
jgi:hypothetical protein